MPGPFLFGPLDDLPGGALFHNNSLIHEDDLVGHVPGKGHLVRDDDHGGLLLGQGADDLQDLPGQLGVQGAGGLVKTEDIRVERQRPGDGHALLLAARKLVRIVVGTVGKAHSLQQFPAFGLDFGVDLLLTGLVLRLLLRQKLLCQHYILQGGVLREQVEGLEHQPEMKPFAADFCLPLG